jgi:gamma-glutamyltranspeptidase/glutathione hydrolase
LVSSAAIGGLSAAQGGFGAMRSPASRRKRDRSDMQMARFGPKPLVTGKRGLAICGHPLAARVAVDVLEEGGNACDALLAAAIAQTVIEPHLTTVTGCFSMLYHDAASRTNTYLNGNVNAPLAPLLNLSGADLSAGRGVAVPGYWAGFEAAAQRLGTLPLTRVMKPAIDLARNGIEVYPALWGELSGQIHMVGRTEQGREIYMPGNVILPPVGILVQKRAADTLERLASEGSQFFYHGEFARRFCEVVASAGGVVTPDDFARYTVRWCTPVKGTYRGYEIVAAAPPDIGGVHLIEMLNLVERIDLKKWGLPTESVETLHTMLLITQEVLTGSARYNDPETHALPLETILSKDYAAIRYQMMHTGEPLLSAGVGVRPGSCHVTVVDRHGNIATALHSQLSLPWQNGLFVDGVSICAAAGHFLRVMPPPGGRVSVLICPNIILTDGRPMLASGSPSTSLLAAIVQNTVNILDFGLPIDASVRQPRFGGFSESVPGALWIEENMNPAAQAELSRRGMRLDVVNPWNYLHGAFEGIHLQGDGTALACGDPRRTSMPIAAA